MTASICPARSALLSTDAGTPANRSYHIERVFDAEPLRRYELPDGSIMHAEVWIGDTVVMLGDAGESWPAVPAHLHVATRVE